MRDYPLIFPVAFMVMSFGTGFAYALHGFFIQLSGSYYGSFVFNTVCYVVGLIAIIIAYIFVKPLKEKYWQDVAKSV
jgi:uncharacterized membrane protein